MGFSIKKHLLNLIGADTQQVAAIEITDQKIEELISQSYIQELAFQTCVGKIANALAKCEFRTFVEGKEVFEGEYYTWNVEPNKNQNKAEFIAKALDELYRKNELLIVETMDKKLLVADGFDVTKNTLYGDSYSQVSVEEYTFQRRFSSEEAIHLKLNNKNVNKVLENMNMTYLKLIEYASKAFLKSRGSRGILNISTNAMQQKNFKENLKKILDEYFRSFFEANNAVLPLFEGYKYEDIGSKTYSETTSRDIKNQYDDIYDFTARAFSMPPSMAKGDVQDTSKAVDEMLTFCIDPLAKMFEQEINRKRVGEKMMKKGTCLTIDTTRVKHIDMFDVAPQADKLISSGIYTINMILRALGEPQIAEDWANQHYITKNYATIQELIEGMK